VLHWVVIGAVAFVAATLAAVSGFGGAAVLLPVLVAFFGIRQAIPILTVAQLIGNASRVWFNRRELQWNVVRWFSLGAVPFAALGAYLFAEAPLAALTRLLGLFLLLVVIWRHLHSGAHRTFPVPTFAPIGAGASFLSALLGSVGPVMAPFFLAYGLVKNAYIGTEAMCTVVMHVTKLVVYRESAVLSGFGAAVGLALGPVMIAGSYLGKRIVDKLPERVFVGIIEAVLIVAGLMFLIRG